MKKKREGWGGWRVGEGGRGCQEPVDNSYPSRDKHKLRSHWLNKSPGFSVTRLTFSTQPATQLLRWRYLSLFYRALTAYWVFC